MQRLTLIGAIIGIIFFLIYGLIPAALYGGYIGLALAGAMFGIPVASTIITKVLVCFGMLFHIVAVGSLFTVLGAILGTGTIFFIQKLQMGRWLSLAKSTGLENRQS